MTSIRSIDELFDTGSSEAAGAGKSAPVTNGPLGVSGWGLLGALYSLTIFLSAFLLFQIQPLIGKFILPWFGGTPGVWTTCMLVFQVLLFGGYAYAHLTISRLPPRAQAALHIILLLAACLALPIVPNLVWKPTGDEEPISRIVLLLGATVGLPFFVLSATGPLLQGWFSRSHGGRSPYRLYALSNAGSLLALVSFPAVFDWIFATRVLAYLWSWSFAVFAVLCAACAVSIARRGGHGERHGQAEGGTEAAAPSLGTMLLWFALAMVPSVLLLATTNQVCLDVASVPFLWVMPLTLYLLSFILCFDSDRWYSRRMMMPAAAVGLACILPVFRWASSIPLLFQVCVYFAVFFLCAMVCHGELVRRKPDARHLTSFYLLIAAGGAAGGIFVGVMAPLVFRNYYELHLGLFACAALMLVVVGTDPKSRLFRARPRLAWLGLVTLLAVFATFLIRDVRNQGAHILAEARNFYGVLRVGQTEWTKDQTVRFLWNGRILHGYEFEVPRSGAPTSYYTRESGVGRLLSEPALKPRRVGLVGLGIGTLAAYANPGDSYRFYEINPLVEPMARQYFHFLGECRGKIDVIPGDARLALDREEPQNFDVLVLDAFSSDAIPVHLLTAEAFGIYLRHVAPKGVIAVHISNLHFALRPVVDAIADKYRLTAVAIDSRQRLDRSVWVLLSRDPEALKADKIRKAALPPDSRRILWTDERASLFEVWLVGIDEWFQQAKTAHAGFTPQEAFLRRPRRE